MAISQYDTFLSEATTRDTQSESTINTDSLYGLYTSWCFINQRSPQTETVFWAAMKDRIPPDRSGLRMKGPAAADYILTSYPCLV